MHTPQITEWYARQRGVSIITRQADARQTGFPNESFDIIVTDAFLTKLPREGQKVVIAEWHRILRSEGRVITTLKLDSNSMNGVRASESQVQRYAEKAEGLAIARQKILGLDPLRIRNLAVLYAKKNISYPVRYEELKALFEEFETTVVSVTPITEYMVTNYAQVVAVKLD